jgi:predicted O-linked N-acetylglucosamine transferase (SPINDLY family)
VLHAAGYPDWIATDREGYARIAMSLAADLPALGKIRQALRPRLQDSRLTDARAFTRTMEDAFVKMVAARELGLPKEA